MYSNAQVNKIISAKVPERKSDVVYVLGIRGNDGKNDRNVYDDRFYVSFDFAIKDVFDGNTDPSAWRTGIATLMPGVWTFIAGKHHVESPPPKGYAAFRQFGTFTVTRDGQGKDTGDDFAINFHRGGVNGTSSLGCQTVKPDQWLRFRDLIYRLLKTSEKEVMANRYGVKGKIFVYILVTLQEAEQTLKAK